MAIKKSYSQLGQDLWVASLFPAPYQGFFVEVGANDGITLSNTYLLESDFNWQGLCIEPGSTFDELKQNRKCMTVNSCVDHSDDLQVVFKIDDHDSLYSGIRIENSAHANRAGELVTMHTQTLQSIFESNSIPKKIDYLSIDTEGNEEAVLSGLNFNDYKIGLITVEHNHETQKRERINELLTKHNFERVRKVDFDDWYMNKSYFPNSSIIKQKIVGNLFYYKKRILSQLIGRG